MIAITRIGVGYLVTGMAVALLATSTATGTGLTVAHHARSHLSTAAVGGATSGTADCTGIDTGSTGGVCDNGGFGWD